MGNYSKLKVCKSYLLVVFLIIGFNCKQNKDNSNFDNPSNKNSENVASNQPEINSSDSLQVINFLKDFYEKVYCAEELPNDSLKVKYVDDALLDTIDSLANVEDNNRMDYDPFIHGQDFDCEVMLKTMKIHFLKGESLYNVRFQLWNNEPESSLKFELKPNSNGQLMIQKIRSDSLLANLMN